MLINCESYVCIKKCQKEDKTVFLKKPKFHFLTFNSRWRSTASAVTHFQQRRGWDELFRRTQKFGGQTTSIERLKKLPPSPTPSPSPSPTTCSLMKMEIMRSSIVLGNVLVVVAAPAPAVAVVRSDAFGAECESRNAIWGTHTRVLNPAGLWVGGLMFITFKECLIAK